MARRRFSRRAPDGPPPCHRSQGWPSCGIGAELGACIYESEAFNYLDAPVERVTGADIPMPYAANLEVEAIPVTQNVINAVQKVCYRSA